MWGYHRHRDGDNNNNKTKDGIALTPPHRMDNIYGQQQPEISIYKRQIANGKQATVYSTQALF